METQAKKYTCDVLIVDDDEFNLRVAGDILKGDYTVCAALSGEKALECLRTERPRLILLDLHMPKMDGRETMRRIRENADWRKIPIIFLTADSRPESENECLMLGASDFITKPFVPMVMKSRISRIIELADLQNDLETRLEEKTRLVEMVSLKSIMVIANTIDAKDEYTSGHSVRVANCSVEIAKRLNWSEEEVQNLHDMALLHDIGKIGVPDSILNKPAQLSKEEFEIIKKHPVIGSDILKDIHMIKNVAEGALYHHECYDGSGYPFGLKGEEIPLCARIIGIADAVDAMTTNRIYRRQLNVSRVKEELARGRGKQFDPQLTDLFLEMLEEKEKAGDQSPFSWGSDPGSGSQLKRVLDERAAEEQDDSNTDVLTGIYNRNYAESRIDRLLADGHLGSVFVMDIDQFKSVNDTLGHIAGDKALQLFADTLREGTKPEDVFCRIGGDEFAVFLTDVFDMQEAEQEAWNLQDALAKRLKEFNEGREISVSIGISLYPGDGKTFEILYQNAAKALYYVKRCGGGICSFYREKGTKERTADNVTDLDYIRYMIEGRMETEQGLFKVEYEDFRKIYHYISRGVKRNRQHVQTLLFTLGLNNTKGTEARPEEAMKILELAAASSLRMVDVGTRYSNIQYIVILMDADLENGKRVADRVVKQFYKMYGGGDVAVTYDIRTMLPSQNQETQEGKQAVN